MHIANMGAAAFGRRPHVCNKHDIFLKGSQTFSNVLNISQMFSNLLKLSQMFSIFLNVSQYFSNILKDPQTFSTFLKYSQHPIVSFQKVSKLMKYGPESKQIYEIWSRKYAN